MSTEQATIQPMPTDTRAGGIRMLFLGFFGTWWTLAGCWNLSGTNTALLSLIAIIGLAIFGTGLFLSGAFAGDTQQPRDLPKERQRAFRTINVVQWAAIAALIVVLNLLGRTEWLFPGIMLIVGLHFLPLARLFSNTDNMITGVALILVATLYPFVTGGPGSPVGPIVAGLILWISALFTLANVSRQRHAAV